MKTRNLVLGFLAGVLVLCALGAGTISYTVVFDNVQVRTNATMAATTVTNTATVGNLAVRTNATIAAATITNGATLGISSKLSLDQSSASYITSASGGSTDFRVTAAAGANGNLVLYPDGSIYARANVLPFAGSTYDLGSSGAPFKSAYLGSGTITASAPVLDLSQTWNNAGVTFTGIKANFTSTASAGDSLPVDIQVDSASKLKLTRAGNLRMPDGTAVAPAYSFGSETNLGIFKVSSGFMGFGSSGVSSFQIGGGTAGVPTDNGYLYIGTTADTKVYRDSLNVLQIGSDSATATTAGLKAADGAGTDKAGSGFFIAGGQATGTAAGGNVIIKTGLSAGATGSSAGSYTERFHAIPKWVTLTESSATTLFTIPVPATNYVGLMACVTIYATDGTDHQCLTSRINVNAVAKTTTITPTVTQVDGTTAASTGTLTCTYTVADNGSNVLAVKANAVSSLTQTVLRAKIVVDAINSNGTAAITEQ